MKQDAIPIPRGYLVLYGQEKLEVRGCRRILLYSTGQIRLGLRGRQLCVLGEELSCTSFSGGGVTVEGKIHTLVFANGSELTEEGQG